MQKFEFSIFIGRFQPFHLAHYELIKEALNQADKLIIVIGSAKRACSPKNPWTAEEREVMMRAALSKEENERIQVIYMRDYMYNDNMWIADLTHKIDSITNGSNNIVLVGHLHNQSSYYLDMFPQWKKHFIKNLNQFPHATQIRYLYFTMDNNYKSTLPLKTVEYLENFKKTTKFKNVKDYFDAIRAGKEEWRGAPYAPIFQTVDAITLRSGHILLVRRGKAYGGGQLALPGGFLEETEKLQTAAIRELKEETSIQWSKEDLNSHVKSQHTFDHPERSERGRTISNAFFIDLGFGSLPKVKGSSDADKAFWLPLDEIFTREEEFFEDHFHIINFFVGSSFGRII